MVVQCVQGTGVRNQITLLPIGPKVNSIASKKGSQIINNFRKV